MRAAPRHATPRRARGSPSSEATPHRGGAAAPAAKIALSASRALARHAAHTLACRRPHGPLAALSSATTAAQVARYAERGPATGKKGAAAAARAGTLHGGVRCGYYVHYSRWPKRPEEWVPEAVVVPWSEGLAKVTATRVAAPSPLRHRYGFDIVEPLHRPPPPYPLRPLSHSSW